MNRDHILYMSGKEIEKFLNDNILYIKFESVNAYEVKEKMIEKAKALFDDTIEFSRYTSYNEIVLIIGKIHISFKVSVKYINQSITTSGLKRKDILKTIGKFKFIGIEIQFPQVFFDPVNLDEYSVKISEDICSNGPIVYLDNWEGKLIDITKDIIINKIQEQNENWKDIRKTIILNAAQPKLKSELFKPDYNQENCNKIIQKTEEVNSLLIDNEVQKLLNIFN